MAHLEGTRRISNRTHKKKRSEAKPDAKVSEEKTAVANIPMDAESDIAEEISQAVTLHLPEFNMDGIEQMQDIDLETNIGANVIVEPVAPPLIPDDDLSSLLLNPTEWADLQLDMLDNYLMDSCFK